MENQLQSLSVHTRWSVGKHPRLQRPQYGPTGQEREGLHVIMAWFCSGGDARELVVQYRRLAKIEACFRANKHDLRIHPVFHWKLLFFKLNRHQFFISFQFFHTISSWQPSLGLNRIPPCQNGSSGPPPLMLV